MFIQSLCRPLSVFRCNAIPLLTIAMMALVFPSASYAQATSQITGVDDTTSTPIAGVPHDYITGLNEIVNPANGSLSVRIKVPMPPERGVNWPVYAFIYDSDGIYSLVPQGWSDPDINGFSTMSGVLLEQATPPGVYPFTESRTVNNIPYSCDVKTGYVFVDPEGGRHPLGLESVTDDQGGVGACNRVGEGNSFVGGDAQYKASIDPTTRALTVVDNHGNIVGAEDTNGNQRSGSLQQNGSTVITATGRQETFTFGTNSETMTFPGTNGSYQGTSVSDTAANGSITLPFEVVSQSNGCQLTSIPLFSTLQGQSGPIPFSFATSSKLTLPNGKSYQFTYDPVTHMLQKIVYPTGAYVQYTWAILPGQEGVEYSNSTQKSFCGIRYGWFGITTRQVSYDGSGIDEEQDFCYTTIFPGASSTSGMCQSVQSGTPTDYVWTSKTTKVTTIDKKTGKSFDTIYTYSPVAPPATTMPLQAAEDRGVMPQEQKIQYYNDTTDLPASLLKTVTKTWRSFSLLSGECETLPNGSTSGTFYTYAPYSFGSGPLPRNGEALLTDQQTDVAEYDYGGVTSVCTPPTENPSVPLTFPIRETKTTYASFDATLLFPGHPSILDRPSAVQVYGVQVVAGQASQVLESETDYAYDGTPPVQVLSGPIVNHDSQYGTSYNIRGNPTQVTRTCTTTLASCSFGTSVTKFGYDIAGQVISSTDANGNTTNYGYNDGAIAGDNSPGVPAGFVTDAFLSTITEPAVSAGTFTQNFTWGYNDGRLWSKKDENGQTTRFCYSTNGCSGTVFDPFFRLTQVLYPDSGSETVSYNDSAPSVTVTTAVNTQGTPVTETKETIYQAMGQNPTETQLQSDPVAVRKVFTNYDGLNRVSQVSNPYWTSSDPSYGVTNYTYDALGRTTSLKHPDNTSQSWQYNSNAVLFTDENGNQWQRTSDALGRLTQVLEPSVASQSPTMETDYGYDALGNLLSVTQWGGPHGTAGSRTRSFVYNGLSELRTSSNPETGTILYTYDANGNVTSKTDARAVKTTYGPYDALNRPAGKSYSDGVTPAVAYTYDSSSITGNQFTKARLTSVTEKNGSSTISQVSPYNYDTMGRVQDIQDCVPTSATACANKLLTYGYNQAGNVDSMTDGAASPAFTLTSAYDGADQLSAVTSTLNTGNYPGTLFQANSVSSTAPSYGPAGLMNASVGVSGTGTLGTLNRSYDSRTQVTGETDMKGTAAVYSYSIAPFNKSNPSASGYDAAGNVVSVSDLVMGTWGYGYDHLNRIASANAAAGSYSSLNMSWTVDAFGDRTAQRLTGSPSAPVPQSWSATMSTANNNRIAITQPSGANWTYDAGGDVTFDGLNDYLYDGEGRICAVEQAFSPFSKFGYVYDGNGDRIAKGTLTSFSCNLATNGFALTNSYVVDKDGEQLTEFQGTTPVHTNVFADGKLLATYSNSNIYFPFTDWLGTKRAEIANNCSSTYASLPYGDELTPHGTCPDATEHHYTGKEHDTESGNDDFGARYYTSTAGRFLSPDWASGAEAVPYAKFDDPQSLNLYGYVQNNPTTGLDPDGHFACNAANGDQIGCQMQAAWKAMNNGEATSVDDYMQQQATQQHNQSAPQPKPTGNPSLDDAATKALQAQNPTSIKEDREYATRAYKNPDGTYSILPFNRGTQASSPHGPISGLPAGTTNAALLHTHGGNDPGYDNEHFSRLDIMNAQREGVPSYLATPSGSIQRYDPGPNKVTVLVSGSPQ